MRDNIQYIYIAFGFFTIVLFLSNTVLMGFISDNICAKIYCMEPERLTMSSVIWIAMLPAVFTGPYFKRYLHAFFIFLMPYLFIATEARVYSGFVLDLQSLLAAYSLLFVFIVTLTLIYLHFVNIKNYSFNIYKEKFDTNANLITAISWFLFFASAIYFLGIENKSGISLSILIICFTYMNLFVMSLYNKRKK